MHEDYGESRAIKLLLFCALVLWAAVVLVRFFQEHPLEPQHVWQLIRTFRFPLPSRNLSNIASSLKHLILASLLIATGVLGGSCVLYAAKLKPAGNFLNEKWNFIQYLLLALGLGWGILMYVIFLLGIAGALYSGVVWGVIGVMLLIGLSQAPSLMKEFASIYRIGASERGSVLERLGKVALFIIMVLLATIALAPSITHDAMVYHLNVPRVYAHEHGIVPIPYNLFSNTVLNVEMLYAAALLIDEFILANLIHYALGVGAIAFLYGFARATFGRATAILAVLILVLNPPVLNEMPIAYVDMAMMFYFLLAASCLWRWRTEGSEGWFRLFCVFAGIFAGIKYTALHGLISLGVLLIVSELTSRGRLTGAIVKRAAIFGATVAVLVLPYLVKNYVVTGNPFYPLMYDLFDGRWLAPRQVERMLAYVSAHGMGRDFRSFAALPWNITIFGKAGFENFDTTVTPLWLILLPAFVLVRRKPAVLKWSAPLCVIYFISWAASTHITRYLMPIFPVLSLMCAHTIVAMGKGISKLPRPLTLAFKAAALAACGLVWFSFAYFYPLLVPSEFGAAVWGDEKAEDFLARKVPNYPVFQYINENLPPDARLMFLWDNRGFFCERPQIGDSVFEAPSMLELAHKAGSTAAFREKLCEMRITHILLNELFFVRFPPFSVSEEDKARIAADIEMLERFLAEYCVPLFSADGATVFALRG
ncbi:MAG: phospholipid carrier-dependent glycosyltransferase [Candidatus Abyssobacteria bacterium SURF_17]|uniref:Phospholipid carrier-dependent glycosyltransferase n=1 Tax=Candidatus Abyssobacteria bacterium SURF_17 TaxID=2093361 RepID=A0A419EVP1_9BACT|nr:MAG: phospholipid carrier-dependent glycosyltransferase [Candidatus Abyssubacteria bacterium SURF_17]